MPSKRQALATAAKRCLQDIAILTGGTVISEELGLNLEDADLTVLGSAKTIKVSKEETTIIDGDRQSSSDQRESRSDQS